MSNTMIVVFCVYLAIFCASLLACVWKRNYFQQFAALAVILFITALDYFSPVHANPDRLEAWAGIGLVLFISVTGIVTTALANSTDPLPNN